LDAERRLSRLSARFVARERFREGFFRRPARPFERSRFAWRFVRSLPRFGGGNFTPARRALERPIAIACSGDRAPCSPSRICSISSRTNSSAWVLGDLPSRSSSCARSIAPSSGMMKCDASTKSKYSAQHSDAAQQERYCVEIFHVKLRHGDVVSHFK